jgi:hypothetical protein
MLKQLMIWLGAPALATWMLVQVLAGMSAVPQAAPQLPPVPAGCVSSPDEMFDACVALDVSQVRDLRSEKASADVDAR